MAKLVFDFFFGRNTEWVTTENQEKLIDGITQVDFSHNNPIWRFYALSESEIQEYDLISLRDYLPTENDGNRDLGNYTNGEFRFGAKHNDIYPIIGDMVRWMLQLPKRKKDPVQNSSEI